MVQIDLATPANLQSGLLRDCVAWWKGIPGLTGRSWPNLMAWSTAGGNHGSFAGTIAAGRWNVHRSPRSGLWLDLQSQAGYVACGVVRPLLGLTRFSLAAWVEVYNPGGNYAPVLTNYTNGGGSAGFGLFIKPNTTKALVYVRDVEGSVGQAETQTALTTGWHRIAFTWSALANPLIYVDGLPVSVDILSSFAAVDSLSTDESPTHIGSWGTLPGHADFDRGLDDLRLWSRVVPPDEILADHLDSLNGYGRTLRLIGGSRTAKAVAPTTYTIQRIGNVSTVTVHTSLAAPFFHWYLSGVYAGMTRSPRRSFHLPDGEHAHIDVMATTDADFDPVAGAPEFHPDRRTLWWLRSLSTDVAHYRVEQRKDAGSWETIATYQAVADGWDHQHVTDRLVDLADYEWRVIAVDAAGNDGSPVSLGSQTVVRQPDGPEWSYSFSAATDKVTIGA